ncbi:DNA polymerase III subunit gamma and tau [Arthrobacter sp. B1805]|uniref:DNA polymerase III subunit gamma and tau n=1 Tax=Arthrobacter sp. B1805 TaxID=2058892 RepID=UPI000CE2BACF|nr:DNA polymerase III subunit gamma and tau [Arthrobacter sp. B1805]
MSTALYRRYRPETFADVIGQEHVTEPLMAAIDKDRINHAYLFSGPRGCGKTTSARILARCLNCAQGPTSTPCGTCDSCVELARNGSGSLDVIEIDAASHGGVDDARDLRERATFAPVRDRFKIFIIDEAHMVTSAGFNALLKIVEEPPEHILFIFATTEPDKVIGTIRSRTHHYPFRLVPPEPLMAYLELLCHQENVPVAPGVLSLVIRAGGGSVRDSLSVLDQLMAGAGESGLDYELAVSLLGYTHATLLDDVVDSVAAGDAATVFNAVDRVIQTGHDPRRFVEDLLERFRDLIVINAVPEGAASILRGVPDDQLNRMRTQANQLGAGELSRAADVTNTALTEMTGATSPRLHLELLCARLLLPAADATARGTLARVDRIERRLEYAGGTPAVEAPEADEVPKAPARPRLDVPRTAEEAAARWSLPAADPSAPAVPAAAPGAHSPAVPAAARAQQPTSAPATADSSPDWGGSWGVSTNSAFSDPESPSRPAGQSSKQPTAQPSGQPTGQPTAQPSGQPTGQPTAQPTGRVEAAGPTVSPMSPPEGQTAPESDRDSRIQIPAGTIDRAQASQPRRVEPAQPSASPHVGLQAPQPPAGHELQPSSEQDRQAVQEPRRPDAPSGQPAASGGNVEMVRRAWPEILDEVARIKRATWLIVNVTAKPRSFEGNQLVLAFANQGNAIGFQRGPHMDNLKQAIHKVLGLTCSIEAVYDADGSGESGPKVPAGQAPPGSNPGPASPAASAGRGSPPASSGSTRPTAVAGAPGSADATIATPTRPGSALPATGNAPAAPRPGQRDSAAAAADVHRDDAARPSAEVNGPLPTGSPARSSSDGPTAAGRLPAERPSAEQSSPAPRSAPGHAFPPSVDSPVGLPSAAPPGAAAQAVVASGGSPAVVGPQEPASTTRRDTTARSDATDSTTPETVSAWDPSMSDDSWALVEPPEEAFDPGPGWGAVPEDPFESRPTGQRGAQAARPTSAPARTGATTATSSSHSRSHASAPAAPATDQRRPTERSTPTPSQAQAPAPEASRSVIWSPPASAAPTAPIAPTGEEAAIPPTAAPQVDARPSTPPPGHTERSAPTRPAATVEQPTPTAAVSSPISSGPSSVRSGGGGPLDRPAAADNVRQKPVSRYQQLLDEAERKRAEEAAAARGAVDLRFVEDEPSADDETIEESGLVGRTAIERILNGRLVEERGVDGQ